MKTCCLFRITSCALFVLCGCAGRRAVGVLPTEPEGRIEHALSIAISNTQNTTRNTPIIFAFQYSAPLTNCYLESSTDLVHWTVRDDYWIGTNTDGTTYWNVRADKSSPREFYRVGGEAIP